MNLLHDLRLALRRLVAAPAFSLAAISMLALGIGFSVAMYCTLVGVLRSLPFPDGERVVMVAAHNAAQDVADAQLTTLEAEQLSSGTPGFDALGYYWWGGITLFDGDHAREITTHMVGPGYFAALGLHPVLGRALSDDDIRQGRPYALLSYGEWQQGFGGDPGVIGRRLELVDEAPLEVIGVMPADMDLISDVTGVWRPLTASQLPADADQRATRRTLMMVGRLHEGVSLAQADAALEGRFQALRDSHGNAMAGWTARSTRLLDQLVGDARGALWGAFALAILVLLIAAANVAILLDARQTGRRHEQAVMQAIGASSARLRRAPLLELLLIAVSAVLLGMAIAYAAIALLRDLASDSIPRVDGIAMDWGVLGFAIVLGLLVPLAGALAGALRVQARPIEAIRAGGRNLFGQPGQRRALPALAMALSTISLVAALSLAAGLWRLQRVDPGFIADNVQGMQFFRVGQDAFLPFTEQLLARLRALPGVSDAALANAPPLSGIGATSVAVTAIGQPADAAVQVGLRRVSPDYRALLSMRLVEGRDIDANDRRGSEPVAVINRELARRLFGTQPALGRMLDVPTGRGERVASRIVGVLDDIRNNGLRRAPAPEVLIPFAQQPTNAMTFLVRSQQALPGLAAQLAAQLHALDPRQAITREFVLSDQLAGQLRPARFYTRTVGAFAIVALLLAVLGVHAVTALQQRRRVGEFGLRLAVGAPPSTIALSVMRDSAKASALGIVAGLVGVALGLRLLDVTALGIDRVPPLVIAVAVLMMGLAALLASLLPALRAARIAPLQALRAE